MVCSNGFEIVYASNGSKYDQLCMDHINKRYILDLDVCLLNEINYMDDTGFSAILVSYDTFNIIENGLIDKGYVCLNRGE